MKAHTPILLAISFALIATASQAQKPDPDVQALLDQVATAYRNLSSFSTTLALTRAGGTTITTKLKLKKPNLLSAEIDAGQNVSHVVADGTTIYVDSSRDTTKYLKLPDTNFDSAISALQQSGGAGSGILQMLFTSSTLEKQITPTKPTSLKHEADQKIENENCDVLIAILGVGQSAARLEYDFGKEDHLLRRWTFGSAKEGEKPVAVETYSEVTTHPTFADATFMYTPHAGAVAVEPPKRPGRSVSDLRLKVGAAPFPITGKDLSGKSVSLNQYRGKVLLLDFWATWSAPYAAELPHVLEVYNRYHGKGFEVLGISLDQSDAKDKVEKFVKENHIPWKQIYDAKSQNTTNAGPYGVTPNSIPFAVLIGRDGKIAAVGARGEELAPAIEAALSP